MSDSSSDIIVVGAGIIGIACAYYLAREGRRVTVIDQGGIGEACSHANCGYICPSHILPLTEPGAVATGLRSLLNPRAAFRIKPQWRLSLYQWLWQFARRCNHRQMLEAGHHLQEILDYSAAEYRSLIETGDLDCEWKEDGLVYVFQSEQGMRKFAATDKLLRANFGLEAERIQGADLPGFDAALKPGLAGAWHYKDDASLRPDKLVRAWALKSKEHGVNYLENCHLDGVETNGDAVAGITTSRGRLTADEFVFATGAWSGSLGKMLNCRLPVEPAKGYSVTMTRPSLSPRHPMLLLEHRVGLTPFDEGFRIGSMMEFVGYDSSIPDYRIRQLQDAARSYLHEPLSDVIEETWYGWRPMTWDSLPIIGRVPKLSNAVIATGHNMLGLSMASGTGRIVADVVAGSAPAIAIGPYCPQRMQ